jgi:hypothetical protein
MEAVAVAMGDQKVARDLKNNIRRREGEALIILLAEQRGALLIAVAR